MEPFVIGRQREEVRLISFQSKHQPHLVPDVAQRLLFFLTHGLRLHLQCFDERQQISPLESNALANLKEREARFFAADMVVDIGQAEP